MNRDTLSVINSFLTHKEILRNKSVSKLFNKDNSFLSNSLFVVNNKIERRESITTLTLKFSDILIAKSLNTSKVHTLMLDHVTDKYNLSNSFFSLFPNLRSLKVFGYSSIKYDRVPQLLRLKTLHIDISNMDTEISSSIFNLLELEHLFVNIKISLPSVRIVKSKELRIFVANAQYPLKFLSNKIEYMSNGNHLFKYNHSNSLKTEKIRKLLRI